MSKKIEKNMDKTSKTSLKDSDEFFSNSSSSDILKKAIAPAVISDQINLFDEELENEIKNNKSSKKVNSSETFKQISIENEYKNVETIKVETETKKEKSNNLKKNKKIKILETILSPFKRRKNTVIELSSTVEEQTEKLEEAEKTVKNQSSKKKKWLSVLFLLINVGVVAGILIYQIKNDTEMSTFGELITSGINWWIFAFAVFLFLLNMFTEGARFWLLTYKTTGKNRPILGYKVAALGRYYDNITPLSAGGEPFQIYYMSKHSIDAGKAVSIPVGKYIFFQLTFVSLGFICMMFSISYANSGLGTALVTTGSWIGFALNFALTFIVLLVSISKKLGDKLLTGGLKFLKKIHFIKDYDGKLAKSRKVIGEYQRAVTDYAKDKWTFVLMMILSYAGLIINYSTPYVIYCMFHGFNASIYWELFVKIVMVDLAACFIPLPGGTGVAELSFTAIFASLMGPDIFWAMLIWRILTYYSYIIQGILITIYDYFRGNKKQKWLEQKWKLEEESRQFEDDQLKIFELSLEKQSKRKEKRERKK